MVKELIDGVAANLIALSQRAPTYSTCICCYLLNIRSERDIVPCHICLDIVCRHTLAIEFHLNGASRIVNLWHNVLQSLLVELAKSLFAKGIVAHSTNSYREQSMLTCMIGKVGRSTTKLRTSREYIKQYLAQAYAIFLFQVCIHSCL